MNVPQKVMAKPQCRRMSCTGSGLKRPDLFIHALAQLPDNVSLEISDKLPNRSTAELLARAYGIVDRVAFKGVSLPLTTTGMPPTMAELVHEFSDPSDPPAACREEDRLFDGQRVAIITNLPAPYRLPLFSKMSRRLTDAGARFRVFFMADRARGRPWIGDDVNRDFEWESLSSIELPVGGRSPLVPKNLGRRLSSFNPTIILAGSLSPFVGERLVHHARRHRAVFGVWSGEIAGRSTSMSRVRRVQRKLLLKRCDFGVAYGYLAGEYLRTINANLPIVYGRNTSNAYAVGERQSAGQHVVRLVAVADMASPEKGIALLVDALKALPRMACSLTVVGPGAEAAGIQARAQSDDRIRFVGALPQAKVRECYSEADVFLFPSTAEADPFGLAPVEAMGSGLAPVMSIGPGVVGDLAVDGWNCVLVRERTADAWARALEKVIVDEALRGSLAGNAAKTIRNRWTMEHACDSMIAGLRLGLLSREPPGSFNAAPGG